MTEPVPLKYRAFISYSHADSAAAKWLHRGLESFRIDKDLAGRETALGPVPQSLKPIFRDRDDFTAGHSLTEQTLAALDASAALIVICSPDAAKSHYVNEEIRLFKSRHPERPVVPLIVAGKPGDPEHECFPPALKLKVDAKGRIVKKRVELLAADVREDGDGKQLALAKVVAALLGVSSDEVFRRAERERRRKARMRNGVAAVLAALALLASGSAVYAWQQLKTNEAFLDATLKTATEIVDQAVTQGERFGVPRTATLALLTRAEALFDNMALLGRETPELRYRKAWMLTQFARNYQALGNTTKWGANSKQAFDLLGALYLQQPDNPHYARELALAGMQIGDALMEQRRLAEAQRAYASVLPVLKGLAASNPDQARLQLDLAIAKDRYGDLLSTQGKTAEAMQVYQEGLGIRERLAAADPGDEAAQRDLSISYEKVGGMFIAQGDLAEGLRVYRQSLAIVERLAAADPHNADRQRDLSVAHNKIGNALLLQGDFAGALAAYREGLAIRDRLAKSDADNAVWQRDLSVAYELVGDALAAQGDLVQALKYYRDAVAIRDRLARLDPDNAVWRSDLQIVEAKAAKTAARQGEAKP